MIEVDNPYKGLKLTLAFLVLLVTLTFYPIKYNPYQGLKPLTNPSLISLTLKRIIQSIQQQR